MGVRLNYMKQVGPTLLQVIHNNNTMQEAVGVVSSASALVIPPFCKLSRSYSGGSGSMPVDICGAGGAFARIHATSCKGS